jgi:perosamine synthetase
MSSKIFYTKPSITQIEKEYVSDAIENGWGANCYDYIIKFEKEFSNYLGTKYSISTSSATGAIHLGMASLGITKGDEVILADTNWIATVAPIVQLGAKPIFIDISEEDWCIDVRKIEEKITSKTKAIVAVHIYGNLCDMEKILELGKKYDIHIIEDSAEAIGSKYKEMSAGSMGSFGAFSFHGTKTMTSGEGGMFVTNDDEIYEKAIILSNHGRSPKEKRLLWSEILGYKYKMSNIQAAIGLGQLQRVNELVRRKQEILDFYINRLNYIEGINFNKKNDYTINGAWMPNITFPKNSRVTRDNLLRSFKNENIDARPFFWPLSSLPMFKNCLENINSYDIPNRSINLPSYHDINDNELERVCRAVEQAIKK